MRMQAFIYAGPAEMTVSTAPDFYLISSEGYGLDSPRKCWKRKPIKLPKRDDLMLVTVMPPIIYKSPEGIQGQLSEVVLAARHVGYSINSICEWPFYVHVAKINPLAIAVEGVVSDDDIETIAWAELYPSEAAASEGCRGLR